MDALKLKLSPEEDVKLAEKMTESVAAFEYYHRAKIEIFRMSEQGLDHAVRILNKGLEAVGANPLLYAGLGLAYYQYFDLGFRTEPEMLEKTKEYAEKTLDLSPKASYG